MKHFLLSVLICMTYWEGQAQTNPTKSNPATQQYDTLFGKWSITTEKELYKCVDSKVLKRINDKWTEYIDLEKENKFRNFFIKVDCFSYDNEDNLYLSGLKDSLYKPRLWKFKEGSWTIINPELGTANVYSICNSKQNGIIFLAKFEADKTLYDYKTLLWRYTNGKSERLDFPFANPIKPDKYADECKSTLLNDNVGNIYLIVRGDVNKQFNAIYKFNNDAWSKINLPPLAYSYFLSVDVSGDGLILHVYDTKDTYYYLVNENLTEIPCNFPNYENFKVAAYKNEFWFIGKSDTKQALRKYDGEKKWENQIQEISEDAESKLSFKNIWFDMDGKLFVQTKDNQVYMRDPKAFTIVKKKIPLTNEQSNAIVFGIIKKYLNEYKKIDDAFKLNFTNLKELNWETYNISSYKSRISQPLEKVTLDYFKINTMYFEEMNSLHLENTNDLKEAFIEYLKKQRNYLMASENLRTMFEGSWENKTLQYLSNEHENASQLYQNSINKLNSALEEFNKTQKISDRQLLMNTILKMKK